MIVLVQASVLTVGLNGKVQALRELPIRVISMDSASKAASSLKNEKIDSVISSWNLDGHDDGAFLRKLKAVKPDIPTIVFVRSNDPKQEIKARSLGVSAVLTEDTDDEHFRQTVANVLGLQSPAEIREWHEIRHESGMPQAKK